MTLCCQGEGYVEDHNHVNFSLTVMYYWRIEESGDSTSSHECLRGHCVFFIVWESLALVGTFESHCID